MPDNVRWKPLSTPDPLFLRCRSCGSLLRSDFTPLTVREYGTPRTAFVLHCPLCSGVTLNPSVCIISGGIIQVRAQPSLDAGYPTPEETLRYLGDVMGVPRAEIADALTRA